MIISNVSSPERSLYVIGANIISLLSSGKHNAIDPLSLYEEFRKKYPEISLSYVLLGLDWLYIIGVIKSTPAGDIELCN
ncbi:ABC-three component system middle component 6 [Aeromonas enteropelogenes]|uniref:ABC-three component system middle component 6 n=1 Tax=Aeromonas enteropelogenes TaxID=29489 RepID=UPI00398942D2